MRKKTYLKVNNPRPHSCFSMERIRHFQIKGVAFLVTSYVFDREKTTSIKKAKSSPIFKNIRYRPILS